MNSLDALAAVLAGRGATEETAIASGTREWNGFRQFGTSEYDSPADVAVGADGSVYVVGTTVGGLSGRSRGLNDVFVVRYDNSGSRAWLRQFGSVTREWPTSAAIAPDGAIYVVGYTAGNLSGMNHGKFDAFFAKYSPQGEGQWLRQIGGEEMDSFEGVAVSRDGSVFVAGNTTGSMSGVNRGDGDVLLAKYDANGERLWLVQYGSEYSDGATDIAVDPQGIVYVLGYTRGDLVGENDGDVIGFIAKHEPTGERVRTWRIGTEDADDRAIAVGADGSVYVSGGVWAALFGEPRAHLDAFVARYDAGGERVWFEQFGTNEYDHSWDIAVGRDGSVYVAGTTDGVLAGENCGDSDVFVLKFSTGGTRLWGRQFGTDVDDSVPKIAVGADGSVYVVAPTHGSLGGENRGGADVVLGKYDQDGVLQ